MKQIIVDFIFLDVFISTLRCMCVMCNYMVTHYMCVTMETEWECPTQMKHSYGEVRKKLTCLISTEQICSVLLELEMLLKITF